MMMISDLVKQGSQFIIATHSPILLAMKNSTIYEVHDESINNVLYDDLESIKFYKSFFDAKERYLRYLD